jgi:hypothetical protein
VARDQELLLARGSADGRLFLLVPELDGGATVGMVLLHVELRERVPAAVLRGALTGYRGRYGKLRDAVMETEPGFRDDLLEMVEVEDLFVSSVDLLARHWRSGAQTSADKAQAGG